ncbi:MAG: response regulator transcription factor [Actinomycetales bacterium]|nr:response regulator transcription factor [Actinomycetales bacterium]
MRRSVLLVEDDSAIRMVLRVALEDAGYEVLEAASGEEALLLRIDEAADLLIVDLRLPGIHGLDVVRTVRGSSRVPIIILTAQAESHDIVAGLEAGADDYVTKPFVTGELLARIAAQLRRAAPDTDDDAVLVCGPLELSPDLGALLVGGDPVPLTRTEFKVVEELMAARERVLSRDHLLKQVWGYEHAGDGRVVDNLIYRLRSKIEADPASPEHLITVRGFGYRLKA